MIDTPPPLVTTSHDDPSYRVHFRMQQIILCVLTVAVTIWLWMIEPLLGIAAAFFAKHIIVAVFLTGNRLPPIERERGREIG
ncbi:MAG TPA: hypothetical protein VHR72_08500 [Gemmataceae bacterium]|jgi:hypothetical protein|nr:hypothetical protein [Gemmataceae bacterium]